MARSVVSTTSGCSPPPRSRMSPYWKMAAVNGTIDSWNQTAPSLAAGGRLEGPQAVGDQHDPGGHAAQVAQELGGVHGQDRSDLAGPIAEGVQLALALAHHHQQRAEAGDDEEPLRDGQTGGGGAADGPEHEAGGDRDDVEDRAGA